MPTPMRIKRFSLLDRVFHFFLMLTFLIQTVTGFSRTFNATVWGKKLSYLFGGYENTFLVHKWVGALMIAGFLIHTAYLLTRIQWHNLGKSIFGPDSLVPNFHDFKHLWQRILWFFGMGSPPKLERWSYWEKFDYFAVYWGLPLLAITGLMAIYPLATSRILPGWSLNIAVFLHRAEAVLAVSYIFVVHFFIGHLRPASFPMNEAMFTGSVDLEEAMHEKPAWVQRLKDEGKLETVEGPSSAPWFRVLYFVFGYAVVIFGVYMLINGIIYSRYIALH